jgi:hypothetical protein
MKLIKIGRGKENDIVLTDDSNISRNHAGIFQDDDENIFLTDLDSANGTFINGKKLKGSELLKANDIVKIGKTVLPWKNYINKIILDKTIDQKPAIQLKQEVIELEKNDEISKKESIKNQGFVYKYLSYNDEYITGNQFFGRGVLSFLLSFFLIGLYMYSVNAYKRAKSLGHSDSACNIWAAWGFLVVILAFTPVSFITNTVPYWYLWWSNGPGITKTNL